MTRQYQKSAETLVSKMTQLFFTQKGVSSVTSSQWALEVLPVREHNSLTLSAFAFKFFWENLKKKIAKNY